MNVSSTQSNGTSNPLAARLHQSALAVFPAFMSQQGQIASASHSDADGSTVQVRPDVVSTTGDPEISTIDALFGRMSTTGVASSPFEVRKPAH